MSKLSEELRGRGYVYQHSSETLEEITERGPRTLYLGVDPSSDSLQVGQLMGFLVLRHFLEAGHNVILLIGGATGMIGDPGGKDKERILLPAEEVEKNAKAITAQVITLLGSEKIEVLDNAAWLSSVKLLDFLRDVGKHVSTNQLIQRDFVKERLMSAEQGISYAELSYALLQAYDYAYLNENRGCDLQVGGSDQWGNIVSGIDLIRRKTGNIVYGLTWPLLINKATGKKFGKTEEGTVWLDAKKKSPFKFYQYWLNCDDESVSEYMRKMTMMPLSRIDEVIAAHRALPGKRAAQRTLAFEATSLVHGEGAAKSAEDISDVLFGEKELTILTAEERELLLRDAPVAVVRVGMDLAEAVLHSGLASSKREARQFIDDGAISLNGGRVSDPARVLMREDFQEVPMAVLKRGKRNVVILKLE